MFSSVSLTYQLFCLTLLSFFPYTYFPKQPQPEQALIKAREIISEQKLCSSVKRHLLCLHSSSHYSSFPSRRNKYISCFNSHTHPERSEDFTCMYLQYRAQEPFGARGMKGSSLIYVPHFPHWLPGKWFMLSQEPFWLHLGLIFDIFFPLSSRLTTSPLVTQQEAGTKLSGFLLLAGHHVSKALRWQHHVMDPKQGAP